MGFSDGQEQLLDILQSYFHSATTYYPNPADAGSTTYFSKIAMDLICESARAVSKLKPTAPPFSRHIDLLQSLASGLRDLNLGAEAGPLPDYLFYASFAYVYQLLNWSSDAITTETGRDLILAISQYRERVIPQKAIEDGFYNSTWRTFGNDWPKFENYAGVCGIVVPPSTKELLADPAPIECTEIQENPVHPSSDAVVEVLDYHYATSHPSSKSDG